MAKKFRWSVLPHWAYVQVYEDVEREGRYRPSTIEIAGEDVVTVRDVDGADHVYTAG